MASGLAPRLARPWLGLLRRSSCWVWCRPLLSLAAHLRKPLGLGRSWFRPMLVAARVLTTNCVALAVARLGRSLPGLFLRRQFGTGLKIRAFSPLGKRGGIPHRFVHRSEDGRESGVARHGPGTRKALQQYHLGCFAYRSARRRCGCLQLPACSHQ